MQSTWRRKSNGKKEVREGGRDLRNDQKNMEIPEGAHDPRGGGAPKGLGFLAKGGGTGTPPGIKGRKKSQVREVAA